MAVHIRLAEMPPEALGEQARQVCAAVLLRRTIGVEVFPAPPGCMRESVRVLFEDGSVVATRRSDRERRERELRALRQLGRRQAPVPRLLAQDGEWIVQEDVGRLRLSQILNDPEQPGRSACLARALAALNQVHETAPAAGLTAAIGLAETRVNRVAHGLSLIEEISASLGLAAPSLDRDRILDLVREPGRDFVKHDVNLADFVVGPEGAVRLVDWEFGQAGCALEDVARFAASALIPPDLDPFGRLRDLCPYAFARGGSHGEEFVAAYGVLMMVHRLRVIQGWRRRGVDWSWDRCVAEALPEAAATGIERLCGRGGAWAARHPLTVPLVPWFAEVQTRLTLAQDADAAPADPASVRAG
jgi:aminoglycoside phosphotransferase (APT) family kinase protein